MLYRFPIIINSLAGKHQSNFILLTLVSYYYINKRKKETVISSHDITVSLNYLHYLTILLAQ